MAQLGLGNQSGSGSPSSGNDNQKKPGDNNLGAKLGKHIKHKIARSVGKTALNILIPVIIISAIFGGISLGITNSMNNGNISTGNISKYAKITTVSSGCKADTGSGSSSSSSSTTSTELTGDSVAEQVWNYFISNGFSEQATAGIMGNIAREDPDFDPTKEQDGSGGKGLFQFSNETRSDYEASGGDYSVKNQLDYVLNKVNNGGYDGDANQYKGNGDVPSDIQEYSSIDDFKKADDVEQATFSWMAKYERCDAAAQFTAFTTDRLPGAQKYYNQFKGKSSSSSSSSSAASSIKCDNGSNNQSNSSSSSTTNTNGGPGQSVSTATDKQKRLIEAANSTPSPGYGWCAAWVTNVFKNAGLTAPQGNACDMFWQYCNLTDTSQLQIGMIVATAAWTGDGGLSTIYGHVGVYVGDGIIMDNLGDIRRVNSQEWIDWINNGGVLAGDCVKFGWVEDLSK